MGGVLTPVRRLLYVLRMAAGRRRSERHAVKHGRVDKNQRVRVVRDATRRARTKKSIDFTKSVRGK